MSKDFTIESVLEYFEKNDITVHKETVQNGECEREFEFYTEEGQNVCFSLSYKENDVNGLVGALCYYANAYDVDYEAYLWIGADGHGKNGACYHIADLVADMQRVKDKLTLLIWRKNTVFLMRQRLIKT